MQQLYIGIDVGSTTIKLVVLNKDLDIVHKYYKRHLSRVRESAIELLEGLKNQLSESQIKLAVTGSAGYGMSKAAGLDFVQEVFATKIAIEHYHNDIDVVIELGGEDAKILFLTGGTEDRKSTRLNSSHVRISYAVFCLKKKSRAGKAHDIEQRVAHAVCVFVQSPRLLFVTLLVAPLAEAFAFADDSHGAVLVAEHLDPP